MKGKMRNTAKIQKFRVNKKQGGVSERMWGFKEISLGTLENAKNINETVC